MWSILDKLKKIKYKKKADIIADKIIFWIKFGWKWLNYIFIFCFFGLIIFYGVGSLIGI